MLQPGSLNEELEILAFLGYLVYATYCSVNFNKKLRITVMMLYITVVCKYLLFYCEGCLFAYRGNSRVKVLQLCTFICCNQYADNGKIL